MIANSDLERLIEDARKCGAIIRIKRKTRDATIDAVQIRGRRGQEHGHWMPPTQAAERLREVITARTCRGCGKLLLPENGWMEDGCPCNSPAGCNGEVVFTNCNVCGRELMTSDEESMGMCRLCSGESA